MAIPEDKPVTRTAKPSRSLHNDIIPLELCLSRDTRKALDGNYDKGRNDTGAAIARDLIGTADHLDSINQKYDGDPERIFLDWCQTVGLDTDKPSGQPQSIWKSALKDNPKPCLSPDKIENCIKAFQSKNRKTSNFSNPDSEDVEIESDRQSKTHEKYEQACDQLDQAIARKWEIDEQILEIKSQLSVAPQLQPEYSILKEEQQQLGQKISILKSTRSNLRMEVNRIHKDQQAENKAPKVFDWLMAIIQESCELFTHDGETYADVVIESIRQTFKTRSKQFKGWISQKLFAEQEIPVNSEALESCLKVCDGLAMTATHPVFMRTANHEGNIYLDLCNDQWQAIGINKHEWRVVDSRDLPVRFVRSPVQVPLPTPVKNDLNQSLTKFSSLWDILSIAEESKPLVTAWLLSCLVPTGDKPILVLSAPKGSGKSTIARFLVNLIDSTKSALLPAVGDRRGFAVQSRHRWIFAYDNLTHLTTEQQDAMCCASTGAGYLERMLFTDSDVTFVEYRRPQILTSVDLVPTRSDLLDRCLLVKVKPLPTGDRKTNEELQQLFDANHGAILGELLDLLSIALGNLDSINQPLQRMASFHKLALAANIPNFNQTYSDSVANAQAEAIKANPIAEAIAELGNFNGSTTALTEKLKAISDDPKVQKLTSRSLGRQLNGTLKTDLEAVGISVDIARTSSGIQIMLQTDRQPKITTQTTLTTQPIPNKDYSDVVNKSQTALIQPQTTQDENPNVVIEPANVVNVVIDNLTTSKLHSQNLDSVSGCVVSVVNVVNNDTLSGTEIVLQSFQIGDRVIWHGKDHLLKKLKGKDLIVKVISPNPNYLTVSCPDWIDQTVAIADLRLAK